MSKFSVVTGNKADTEKTPFPHPSTCPVMVEMPLEVGGLKLVWSAPKHANSNENKEAPNS